jgi:meso-butanediol dehydrogenase / (S,S)-butanediol dehydrogenase / diacetyl reductase
MSRRVLITGGASGIGYGVAEALLHNGDFVLIGDLNEPGLERSKQALNGPRLRATVLDVTCRESANAAVAAAQREFGGLDALVNCAGTFAFLSLDQMREEDWDRVLSINLKGVFLCCKAAAPLLAQSGRGRIVNLSSDAGQKGFPLISAYCASKFGVIGFSRAIAGELAQSGVTVNCVCPTGVTDTGMGKQILQWLADKSGTTGAEVLAARERSVPMGRMAAVADVVNAVLFFLSDASGFITGETLNVDGGVLATGVVPGIGGRQ